MARAANADIVLTNKVIINREVIVQLPHLRYIGVLATGYNVVDIEKASLEDLLATSDVVSLHCPLTEKTRQMINGETLRLMKSTAILINTGRGPLVDDQAIAEALEEKRLTAFCADVLTEEPPKADHPLLKQPNAFITPHIAWATKEARGRLIQVATDNVRSFLSGQVINMV